MKPLRIEARAYGPFDRLDVDLPLGAVAVIGPNGAGKSMLVNAIDRALFGSRQMSDWLTTGEDDGAMSLTLEFEHAGQRYKVRRTFSPRGRGSSKLDFERFELAWEPLTLESVKATQERIESVLGFDRPIFRASAFLVQRGAGSFTDPGLDPRQRKQLLCDLLGLSVYDRLLERVRYRATTIRDVTTRLSIQVEEAERELEQKIATQTSAMSLRQIVGESEAGLRFAETQHRDATEKLNASREVAAKLTAAREVLASRERDLQTATARRSTLVDQIEAGEAVLKLKAESEVLAGRRESIERDLDAAREGEKARDEHRRLVAERDRLNAEANDLWQKEEALIDKFTALENAPGRCDRCQQALEGDAWKQAIRSMKTEALGYHEQATKLKAEADAMQFGIEQLVRSAASAPNAAKQAELEAALLVSREAERMLATIAEREKVVEELALEFATLEVRVPAIEAWVEGQGLIVTTLEADAPTEDLEAAVARAYGVLHEARNDVEGAKSRLAVATAELERLAGIETRTKENRVALAEHQRSLDVLILAERAYGKAGIPALVLENRAIPLLEAKANEALSKLGGKTASARIELRTQREKKDGAGVVEALDIMIITESGHERNFDLWSGSEKVRIDIALRLGLMALAGAEIGILILDEPPALDEQGKADLVDLLNSLLAAGVERVLLVSHEPELRDSFDQTIEIEVTPDGGSRVVGAVGAEAVAAA